jgi:hypothetical protein
MYMKRLCGKNYFICKMYYDFYAYMDSFVKKFYFLEKKSACFIEKGFRDFFAWEKCEKLCNNFF